MTSSFLCQKLKGGKELNGKIIAITNCIPQKESIDIHMKSSNIFSDTTLG